MKEEISDNRDPTVLEMFRQPGARSYLFIGLVALIIYYMLMAARVGDMGTLLTLCFAVPGLLARWTISPAIFLILGTYMLYDPYFEIVVGEVEGYSRLSRYRGWRASQAIDVEDILLGASILVYLICQFRLLSLVRQSMPDDPPPRRKGQPEPVTPRRPARLFMDREVGVMFLIVLGSVIGGVLGWRLLTGYENTERLAANWGIVRPFARVILLFWVLIVGGLVIGVMVRYRDMLRMSRTEARLYLQDQFWQETRREQERIYRWRRWFRQRQDKVKRKG